MEAVGVSRTGLKPGAGGGCGDRDLCRSLLRAVLTAGACVDRQSLYNEDVDDGHGVEGEEEEQQYARRYQAPAAPQVLLQPQLPQPTAHYAYQQQQHLPQQGFSVVDYARAQREAQGLRAQQQQVGGPLCMRVCRHRWFGNARAPAGACGFVRWASLEMMHKRAGAALLRQEPRPEQALTRRLSGHETGEEMFEVVVMRGYLPQVPRYMPGPAQPLAALAAMAHAQPYAQPYAHAPAPKQAPQKRKTPREGSWDDSPPRSKKNRRAGAKVRARPPSGCAEPLNPKAPLLERV